MKTFTNYAEKKAKQFLNLLQGYTKGIRITVILILLLMGVSNAWAYNYGGTNVYYYFANTASWSSVHLYIWNGTWNTDFTLTQIANTKVYYYKWSSAYNGNEGILFRGAADWDHGQTGDIKADYTSHTSWVQNNTTGKTDLSNINRQAKVVAMLSTGGNYTATANANCTATVSGYTVEKGKSTATSKSASTSGSANNASISAAYGSTITYTATAGTGYTFKGFSTSNSTSLPASPSASGKTATASGYGSSNNTTYYAYFKANQYTVKFDANGGTGSMSNQSHTYSVSQALTANAFTRTGYTFEGWNTKADGTGNKYTDKQSVSNLSSTNGATITLYAQWTANTYTITYKDQGNVDFSGTHASGYPTQHTYGTATTLKTATKTGYTFGGWFTNSGCTGSAVTSLGATAYTANITLYAKWTLNDETKYEVTAVADPTTGGTVTPATATLMGVNSGDNITATPNEGYEFTKWSLKSGHGYFGETGTYNTSTTANTIFRPTQVSTIKATFTEIQRTITVTSTNALYGTVSPTTVTAGVVTQSEEITATPEPGYKFTGWSVTQGTGKITLSSTTALKTKVTKALADGTITAEFQEKTHDVIISYKYGNTHLQSATTQEVGEAKATSIEAPEHTGYTFTGWTLGTGITNHSANTTANPISITTNSTGSGYTLVANYTKNSYTFNLMQAEGGNATATVGSDAITSSATLEHGTIIALAATADDKYKFSKWVDGNGTELSTTNPYTHTLTASTTISPVFTSTDVLYLKPNENWKSDGAWFAAYFFKKNTAGQTTHEYWAKMKKDNPCDDNGHYKVKMPEGDWTHVIFCRMNSGSGDLNWNNKWNQTADLELPKNDNNCFAVKDGTWDKGGGTWSSYTSKAAPLVFNVTVPANTPNCYIIGAWDGWKDFTEMTKVDDTHYTVSIPDACDTHGYKYCYGPSWGCQEVKNTNLPTQAISDRSYSNQDEVKAWIKYCLVGDFKSWNWNNDYQFTLLGDLEHDFDKKDDHNFKVMSSIGAYLAHSESYTYGLHRQHTSVKIAYEGGNNNQLILTADVAGNYKFHFDAVSKLLTIEFPEKGYRLKITMTDGSKKVYTSNAVDDETEILSFFAPGSDDTELSGTIILEQKGSKKADIPATLFKTSGVYTAKLNSDKNGITNIEPYDGNYYIRTDGANGGWGNYKTDSDNKMTYFVPREEEKYSYYWVQALPRASRDHTNGVVNVKACVANDYNDNLAVMLGGDRFTSDADGNVKIIDPDEHHREKINVRFGYNPKTNHFERAMLTGSGNINTFLNITDPLPEGHIWKTNNNGTLETQLTAAGKDNKFTDISNWVYERDIWVDVQADEDVTVCLTAVSYNGARNSLFGFNDAEQTTPTQRIIAAKGSTPAKKKMRVIYDFKTNRMIMAWMPGEYNCKEDEILHSDVLFLRHENDLVPQLTIEQDKHIKGIQSQFFALEFENRGDANYEEHYWITLPFDCVVGSISGVPGYMQIWGIQRYRGDLRAQKGWFKETDTFWEWMKPDDVMEAGVGYVLTFDKKAATWNTFDVHTENADGTITTTQRSLLRLYFPSTTKGFTFESHATFEKEYADEPCTIKTDNRYLQDGNWKVIGSLSYNSATAKPDIKTGDNVWKPEEDGDHVDVSDKWSAPMFRYKFQYDNSTVANSKKWKYIPEDGEKSNYQAFYGYMVQFAGLIKWSEVSQSIHPRLRARTYTDQVPTNITTQLELVDADGNQQDQTFVSLDIEGTTTFDLNKDLNKVFNSNFANLYTLSEDIPFAGNTLPMEKAIVPVGVRIATAGEYTFRMPDGTDGISVTLVDNATGTHTDMLMDEYTITLDAGTIENRFYLVVDPDRAATSVENVGEEAKGEEAKGIEKFLIDGKLFIRTAEGIFDAKGQRL